MRADQFASLDKNLEWFVEKGKMTVRVGKFLEDSCWASAFTIMDSMIIDGKNVAFMFRLWMNKKN